MWQDFFPFSVTILKETGPLKQLDAVSDTFVEKLSNVKNALNATINNVAMLHLQQCQAEFKKYTCCASLGVLRDEFCKCK